MSMLTTGNVVALPLVDSSWKVEPGRDYAPVIALSLGPFIMTVSNALGVHDMKGLIANARANPGKLNAGAITAGGLQHIYTGLAFDSTGADVVIVPFKGSAVAIPALVNNDLQVLLADSSIKPLVDAG